MYGLPAVVLQRVHLSQSAHRFSEVQVNVTVALVTGEYTDRKLVFGGSMLAIVYQIHEGVKERQARVLQRETEVTLSIVDPN